MSTILTCERAIFQTFWIVRMGVGVGKGMHEGVGVRVGVCVGVCAGLCVCNGLQSLGPRPSSIYVTLMLDWG